MTAATVAKTLCEREKALKRNPAVLEKLTDTPRFECKKCGRLANKKKYVCKPRKLAAKVVRPASRQVA